MGIRQRPGGGSAPKGSGEGQEGACAGLWSSSNRQRKGTTTRLLKMGGKKHNERPILPLLLITVCSCGTARSPWASRASTAGWVPSLAWQWFGQAPAIGVSKHVHGFWPLYRGWSSSPAPLQISVLGLEVLGLPRRAPAASLISVPSRFWGELALSWVSGGVLPPSSPFHSSHASLFPIPPRPATGLWV